MNKLIPLNCLIIAVGPNTVISNKKELKKVFSSYEIVCEEQIKYNLVGKSSKNIDFIVNSEICRITETKLKLGERVIINADNLKKEKRTSFANIGIQCGVPVFYLICDDNSSNKENRQKFLSSEKEIRKGDGLVEVISNNTILDPVIKYTDELSRVKERYNGITVVGDVHGMHQSLLATLDWARLRKHFVLFLGDIVDYGPGSLECADEVYRTVMRGNGELIIGNHERKIVKWIDQNDRGRHMMKLSDGNRVTINALKNLGSPRNKIWMNRFKGMVARSSFIMSTGSFVFTHAAIHPSWWSETKDYKTMENYSLFGEFDPTTQTEKPRRTYDWVDAIPEGNTVIVGHDSRSSTAPFIHNGKQGGQAIFLDTGSGKGGVLSSLDLRFTENGEIKMENFTRH